MDKGILPCGEERHLPDDIKNSPHYIATTQWGKNPSPGSHASQRDYPPRAREENSGRRDRRP